MRRLRLAVLFAAVCASIGTAGAATPPPLADPPPTSSSVFDPRRIPSVPEAEAALAAAQAWRAEVMGRIAAAEDEQARVRARIAELDAGDRELAARVEQARVRARTLLVEAYVGGGPISVLQYLVDAPSAGDLTWRRYLVRSSAEHTHEAARLYQAAREEVSAEVLDLVLAVDRARLAADEARAELVRAEAAVSEAEVSLLEARHEADHRAGRIVVRSGDDGGPTPDQSGNARGPGWAKLRECESGGNYAIADRTGAFRGAYQFAVSTWYGVGGVGDPADAPPAEQDYRAQVLYEAQGARPWPVCGRFLLEEPPEG